MSLLFKILCIALKYKYKLIFINRISRYTSKISDIINMNIKENLTIVKDNLNDEEIIKVYKLSYLYNYIMSIQDREEVLFYQVGKNKISNC